MSATTTTTTIAIESPAIINGSGMKTLHPTRTLDSMTANIAGNDTSDSVISGSTEASMKSSYLTSPESSPEAEPCAAVKPVEFKQEAKEEEAKENMVAKMEEIDVEYYNRFVKSWCRVQEGVILYKCRSELWQSTHDKSVMRFGGRRYQGQARGYWVEVNKTFVFVDSM